MCHISESVPGDLQGWIGGVGQSCTTPIDANRHSADEVAHPHSHPGPKESKAGIVIRGCRQYVLWNIAQLGGEDDGHDHAVDSHHFAEDDRYQILRPYPWGFHAAAQDG